MKYALSKTKPGYNKKTDQLVGKTIQSIDQGSINCWNVHFTDGTSVSLWAEIDGPYNLGQLYLDVPQDFKPALVPKIVKA